MSNIRSFWRALRGLIMAIRDKITLFLAQGFVYSRAASCVETQRGGDVHVAVKRETQISSLKQEEHGEDSKTLAFFLNLAMKDIHDNPSSLEAYTEEMSLEDDELLAGVEVDW